VNAEHRQRELIESARDTSDFIIEIADSLNSGLSYDDAMNAMLESMSRVIHPERLYIFERWEKTSDNTFEWCAPGVEPEIEMLQNLDNAEFDTWDRMLATDSVVVIPDVSAYKGVDDRLYELLTMQGIDRLLAVPFYDRGKLIGYLGADNYAPDEHLDTRRLLETVASFVCARMVNRRLMDELERLSSHDSLTGLLNRRGFQAAMDEAGVKQVDVPVVIALIDLDDFKHTNDTYGHACGDEALCEMARFLERVFPEDAILCRTGGDEFMVCLLGEDAERIEEIVAGFKAQKVEYMFEGVKRSMTASIGYSLHAGKDFSMREAFAQADEALYEDKRNKRLR
jgi:diguanylate cyclase (GGDEF)-like protein